MTFFAFSDFQGHPVCGQHGQPDLPVQPGPSSGLIQDPELRVFAGKRRHQVQEHLAQREGAPADG